MWFFFFKQKTAYEMRISDWSSDVCSSDLEDFAGVFVGHALVGIDEGPGEVLGHAGRVGEQAVGQRFQSGFACDLRAGAALRLVRQVQVFEPRLAVGGFDVGRQFVAQLALLVRGGGERSREGGGGGKSWFIGCSDGGGR